MKWLNEILRMKMVYFDCFFFSNQEYVFLHYDSSFFLKMFQIWWTFSSDFVCFVIQSGHRVWQNT